MSMPRLFHDPALAAALFERRYRRPPPWFELVELDELGPLAWELSKRLRVEPPSIDLARVLHAAQAARKHREPLDPAYACEEFEPLPAAAARLHLPMEDRTAVLWYELEPTAAARLRTRDLLEFHELLWREYAWLIDDQGAWVLDGGHARAAFAWKFR